MLCERLNFHAAAAQSLVCGSAGRDQPAVEPVLAIRLTMNEPPALCDFKKTKPICYIKCEGQPRAQQPPRQGSPGLTTNVLRLRRRACLRPAASSR